MKKNKNSNRSSKTVKCNSGQSLFEIVLSLGIMTAVMIGLVSLTASAIRNATYSKNRTLASRYAQETVEWLRKERDDNYDVFKTKTLSATWCLSSLDWSQVGSCTTDDPVGETLFYREVTFSTDVIGGKTIVQVDVRVYWEDAQGTHEVKNVTKLADWRQR